MVAARTVAAISVDLESREGSGMQSLEADVHSRIVALVRAILAQNVLPTELGPDARLVDAGLTSMDMVNLMLSVEAEFDFTIPQHDITPENFQSVETLRRMVMAQLQPIAV
jgi:acyl carrier protein